MTAILIVIIAIMALYIKDLYELYAVCRRQVNDVHDYYNKVLRNNAEITAALFPQIIRELEELGEVKEANRCKGILADAEKDLAKKEWVPPTPKFTSTWQ